jgi:hypothetical protein
VTDTAAIASLAPKITMRRALSDPALLGNVLAGESWRAWRIMLIAMMGEALDDEERTVFAKLTNRQREPLRQIEEFWGLIRPEIGKKPRHGGPNRFPGVFLRLSIRHGGRRTAACVVSGAKPQAGDGRPRLH